MHRSIIRIISRESPLAMWQAAYVRDRLIQNHPALKPEITGIKSQADKFLNLSLEQMGGKGAFIKELEQALLNETADLAVHSMKDVTIDLPDRLSLPVVLEREDVRDVLISNSYKGLEQLPDNAKVGTSSLRRKCQLSALRPDLEVIDIRGNVGTRLGKLDAGEYDALIMAAAGVKRLGLQDRIQQYLDTDTILPAIGQGALGLEIRTDDDEVREIISVLNDEATNACVTAERSFNRVLNGGCHAPVAAHAELKNGTLTLQGLVGRLDGSELLQASVAGPVEEAELHGEKLGRELLDLGAGEILRELVKGESD